jgi:hypothetical protein
MKGVLLWCWMGVHVDKKSSNYFFVFLLIFMIFVHMVHEKNAKMQIQATRCQDFGNN